MFEWYKKVVFENYANFSGRARRSEYWYFTLVNTIIYLISTITSLKFPYFSLVYLVYNLAILLPSLAVGIRRMHDVGKSGWFLFIALIPLVGAIWLLVLFFTEGNRGENQYGSDPKAIEGFEAA